jgi:predicted RNA-binding Zn-ribbon protein involved in translation (DUF1610 family)
METDLDAHVGNARRGQMPCPDCGVEIVYVDAVGLTDDVRAALASHDEWVFRHGPREGARLVLVRIGETFHCPACGHEFITVHASQN